MAARPIDGRNYHPPVQHQTSLVEPDTDFSNFQDDLKAGPKAGLKACLKVGLKAGVKVG